MPKIKLHYIWWGPVPGDNLASVSQVAKKFRSTLHVHLWCQKAHASDFADVVDSTVQVCGLDASGRSATPGELLPSKVAGVVRILEANRAYSAIKDVLMLYLLAKEGGGYLDTTTAPMPGDVATKSSADTLDGGLALASLGMKNFLGFAFPEVGFGGLRDFYPGSVPWKSEVRLSGQLLTPSIDYWAAWSEPGNPVIQEALATYVGFVAKMPETALQSDKRDVIIGDLITLSMQYAMLPLLKKYSDSKTASPDGVAKTIGAQMWKASVLTQSDAEKYGANFTLPPLGIMKWHKGTWRKKKVTE